jgi:hypothetical protein
LAPCLPIGRLCAKNKEKIRRGGRKDAKASGRQASNKSRITFLCVLAPLREEKSAAACLPQAGGPAILRERQLDYLKANTHL